MPKYSVLVKRTHSFGSFRRGGVVFSAETPTIIDSEQDAELLKRVQDEPMLIITEITGTVSPVPEKVSLTAMLDMTVEEFQDKLTSISSLDLIAKLLDYEAIGRNRSEYNEALHVKAEDLSNKLFGKPSEPEPVEKEFGILFSVDKDSTALAYVAAKDSQSAIDTFHAKNGSTSETCGVGAVFEKGTYEEVEKLYLLLDLSADGVKDSIASLSDLSELCFLLNCERIGKDRKTVTKRIEERIEAVKPKQKKE